MFQDHMNNSLLMLSRDEADMVPATSPQRFNMDWSELKGSISTRHPPGYQPDKYGAGSSFVFMGTYLMDCTVQFRGHPFPKHGMSVFRVGSPGVCVTVTPPTKQTLTLMVNIPEQISNIQFVRCP